MDFHITRTVYNIKLADQKTNLCIGVYQNICTEDQREWAEIRIAGLIKREYTSIYY